MTYGKMMICAALMALTLVSAGCGSSGDSSTTDSENGGGGQVTIGFVPAITSDPFFVAMEHGAEEEAKKLGVSLNWQGSPDTPSPEAQIPYIDGLLVDHIDGLVLSPVGEEPLQPSVDKAKAQGVPVVTVDTSIANADSVEAFITGDNVDGGERAAEALAEAIGEKGEVFIESGDPTATTNSERAQGFEEKMKSYPNVEVVGTEYHESSPTKAASNVSATLLKYPDLAGIFAVNGTGTTGAVSALRSANEVEKVKLVGYDAYPESIEYLMDGSVAALVAQQPAQEGAMAVRFAYAAATGKGKGKIQHDVTLKNVVLTKANFAKNEEYAYPE